MAELKQTQCSRQGYLTNLKKLLQSAEELLSRTETLSNDDVAALRDLHEQPQKDLITAFTALDVKILEATKGDDEIEAEVLQSEETASAISTTKAKIISCLNRTAPPEVITTSTHATSPPTPWNTMWTAHIRISPASHTLKATLATRLI